MSSDCALKCDSSSSSTEDFGQVKVEPICRTTTFKDHEQVENQIIRCTEITCMYSSNEEVSKISTHDEHKVQMNTSQSKNLKKLVDATLDIDKDILLEVDTNDPQCCGLKDVQAVELVIAVQSAIKQRQDLIQEWKNRTTCLTEQIEKLQNDKITLEKSNLSKESELELLTRKLHELHKQYKILLDDSGQIKSELECLKAEYNKLSETYKITVCELKDTKRKLSDAVSIEKSLESRLKLQINRNENVDQNSQRLESELEGSRRNIKKLTNSLEETAKELLCAKQTIAEYKQIEEKLEKLKIKYQTLKVKFSNINSCLGQAQEDNSSFKEMVSNLNLTIQNLTADKNELTIAVQCLNREKNCLLETNNKLSRELTSIKQNFAKVQIQLKSFQIEVDSLKMKIGELDNCNQNLHKELKCVRQENKHLNDNLVQTVSECTTLSRALSEAQSQLDIQQTSLAKVESKVRHLMQEKQTLENLIGSMKQEKKDASDEIYKLGHENSLLRNQNNDLVTKFERVSMELNENLTEIKHLETEIEQLRHTVQTERTKHENKINRLQEKMRQKSHEWKEYVTKEVQRLRFKRRADIKKYLEMNKELETRLQVCQENAKTTEEELTQNIMSLTTQLECCRRKLEETIDQAQCEKNEIIEKAGLEQAKLKEMLSQQKVESQWLATELESKIQNLIQKSFDDETTINTLLKENACIKETIDSLKQENCKFKGIQTEIANLKNAKHVLECELSNCKGLLKLSEETVVGLKADNCELKDHLKNEEKSSKILQTKIIKLKKIIGKKDAQIDMLNNTISQLKERLGKADEENIFLKSTFSDLEFQNQSLTEKIQFLNQELCDAKRALEETGDDRKQMLQTISDIERAIKKLEYENSCLQSELQSAKESQYMSEKALQNSHLVQVELKEKLLKAESMASKSANEAKHLECKLQKMNENAKKLESDLSALAEAYQYNEIQSKKKIEILESQLSCANEEICTLRKKLEKSEKRIQKFKEALKQSHKAFCSLVAVFDSLRETLCKVLCVEYVSITPEQTCNDTQNSDFSVTRDYTEFISAYSAEVDKYSKHLIDLNRSENELGCKLANTKKDFEKLSRIMKELQCEYTQKVEKLHKIIKEKDDLIKSQEKQLVKLQLDSADADEVLVHSLKCKIEEQQNLIKKLQDEKSVLQSEILSLAKKVNHLESQIFELVEKLKSIENKNSKLHVKNMSLEGDLEKMTLVLKEARDVEQDQICQYKEMMLANRELMEKIRSLKCEIERQTQEIDELKSKKSHQSFETKCCIPSRSNACQKELEAEIKVLTEKLSQSQCAEKEARSAVLVLEKNLSKIKKDLAASQAEKASLEGWVSHLQQLISGGYVVDSNLPQQLSKVEKEKHDLQKTIDTLKHNISSLTDEKTHLRNTVNNLTKCNSNLQATISMISKNKDLLEKELCVIQKKVDGLSQGVKSTDSELSICTKDLGSLIEHACSLTKSLKCSDSHCKIDLRERPTAEEIKSFVTPNKFTSDESIDTISVTVGCHTVSSQKEKWSECVMKQIPTTDFSTSLGSNACQDCHYMESKHSEITHIKESQQGEIKIKPSIKKKSSSQSKDSLYSGKSDKTFV